MNAGPRMDWVRIHRELSVAVRRQLDLEGDQYPTSALYAAFMKVANADRMNEPPTGHELGHSAVELRSGNNKFPELGRSTHDLECCSSRVDGCQKLGESPSIR